jgi:ubiquinone/menaquinone biosynthesis C-methylase UbiE
MTSDPWTKVRTIMTRHRVDGTAEEFQRQVNVVFHDAEAEVYDDIHREMWECLPVEFELLAGDVAGDGVAQAPMRALDIGCGTGLGGELLLGTALGRAIGRIDLVDTSAEMLSRASARARNWRTPHSAIRGRLEDLAPETYDVVLACSVLHHIPHLDEFLAGVRRVQRPGGVLLHLQDPNADYQSDPQYLERCAQLRRWREAHPARAAGRPRYHPGRILSRLIRGPEIGYIGRTNQALLARRVVDSPLSEAEIWTITDIHDHEEAGISLESMRRWLQGYERISFRSYGFFGQLASQLPPHLAVQEARLRAERAPDGRFLSAAWRKTAG